MLIAWKNIMARKWSSAKVALSILAMVIIMCIFTSYSIALGEETDKITKSYRSAHNVIIETTAPLVDDKLERAKNVDGIGFVSELAFCRNLEGFKGMTFTIDGDGKEYQCKHKIDHDDVVYRSLHSGNFAFYSLSANIITDYHEEELSYRWKGEKSLIAGRDYFNSNDEIVVSESFVNELQELGFSGDILNKKLTIAINNQQFTSTVVGILNSHFYMLTDTTSQHFIVPNGSNYFSFFEENDSFFNFQTKLYIKEYKLQDKLIEDIKSLVILNAKDIYLGDEYGLSMSTTVMLIGSILNGIMATVGLGIISALILNIMYSMRFMMKKKNNFYAIMQVYGMDKKKMFFILFWEMVILSLFSSIIAYAISYGLVYLLDYLMSSMVGVGVIFGWINFLVTFAIAVIFTLLVVLMVSLINYSLYYKRSTSKMLRTTMEN